LATAEQWRTDVFLTTDDDLLHRVSRHQDKLRVKVLNRYHGIRKWRYDPGVSVE
jgi:hypothetical protein